MTADLSKDDKKRQKMALPEGMKRNSDLGIAPPQKSESRSGSHHKDELKSGRTSSDNGGNRPNGLLPPVKNGTAGGSHHQPRSSVPSGIASSGNGRPLSNPLKSSAHSTSAKFGFNSPSSKVSGSEPSVNESLRNVSSIQSKSSPMGSQSHRHQSASSGSRSSHSTPQPAISVEALSEANLNEESMDVEDNSLVNLPDENLM